MNLTNQKGSFPVIIAIAILCCVGAYFLYKATSVHSTNINVGEDSSMYLDELRTKIENALADKSAIDQTIAKNPNVFGCLFSADGDCAGAQGTFMLIDGGSKLPISNLGRSQGFGENRAGCSTYPSSECPYKVEAEWHPVCAGNSCLRTNSFNVKVKLIYDKNLPNQPPFVWETEKLVTPTIQLSQSVQCSRDGGVWAGSECLTGGQAREVASDSQGSQAPNAVVSNTIINEENLPVCQDRIELQGQSWNLTRISTTRAELKMPAVNGCPAEDLFVFQCTGKNPPDYYNEGQWVQVEASMAQPCDEYGNPIQPEAAR